MKIHIRMQYSVYCLVPILSWWHDVWTCFIGVKRTHVMCTTEFLVWIIKKSGDIYGEGLIITIVFLYPLWWYLFLSIYLSVTSYAMQIIRGLNDVPLHSSHHALSLLSKIHKLLFKILFTTFSGIQGRATILKHWALSHPPKGPCAKSVFHIPKGSFLHNWVSRKKVGGEGRDHLFCS